METLQPTQESISLKVSAKKGARIILTNRKGLKINRKGVYRLMKEGGLLGKVKRLKP